MHPSSPFGCMGTLRFAFLLLGIVLVGLGFVAAGEDIVDIIVGGRKDDIRCLQGLKSSLQDPQQKLISWEFPSPLPNNHFSICNFLGVTCWHENENRILYLELPGLGLRGSIPASLQYSLSITSLNLARNELSGPIPPNLCDWLPFLSFLDLSGNKLSGPIPAELYKCKYLNSLNLAHNSLSGEIPSSISRLDRLSKLNLSYNRLSGRIPSAGNFWQRTSSHVDQYYSIFVGNDNLCGPPLLYECSDHDLEMIWLSMSIILGFVVGF